MGLGVQGGAGAEDLADFWALDGLGNGGEAGGPEGSGEWRGTACSVGAVLDWL